MKSAKKAFALFLSVALILALSACSTSSSGTSETTESPEATATSTETVASNLSSDYFTDRDLTTTYESDNATIITLNGTSITVDGDGASVSGSTVTINNEGTYIVSGTLTSGQIIVNAGDTDKIQIVLNGVNITSKNTAAIYVKQADKVFVTMSEGSTNTLKEEGTFNSDGTTKVDAVIFSKDDLTLNGNGTLTVTTSDGNGITSKDDLVITSGTYNITSTNHGLEANDDLNIADGTFKITVSQDGIHCDNDDDSSLGNVYIAGGTFTINAGDDAMHASNSMIILDGMIDITSSYEGIEGKTIDISGGTISVVSSDDGLNATDPNTSGSMSNQADAYIKISGGNITIDADGDGIDSNGSFYVSGGTIYVAGPTNNGNGALDYNGEAVITGGTLIAAGASGMAENFGTSSTQGSILVTLTSTQTGTITISDSSGNKLASFSPNKSYNSVVISTSALKTGSSYIITAGSVSQTITLSSLIYGSGSGQMNNPGGNKGGASRPGRN